MTNIVELARVTICLLWSTNTIGWTGDPQNLGWFQTNETRVTMCYTVPGFQRQTNVVVVSTNTFKYKVIQVNVTDQPEVPSLPPVPSTIYTTGEVLYTPIPGKWETNNSTTKTNK